jgi:hypothetical protein
MDTVVDLEIEPFGVSPTTPVAMKNTEHHRSNAISESFVVLGIKDVLSLFSKLLILGDCLAPVVNDSVDIGL